MEQVLCIAKRESDLAAPDGDFGMGAWMDHPWALGRSRKAPTSRRKGWERLGWHGTDGMVMARPEKNGSGSHISRELRENKHSNPFILSKNKKKIPSMCLWLPKKANQREARKMLWSRGQIQVSCSFTAGNVTLGGKSFPRQLGELVGSGTRNA